MMAIEIAAGDRCPHGSPYLFRGIIDLKSKQDLES
jgi:hypothetical protein